MIPTTSTSDAQRQRRRVTATIKESMRELSIEFSLLNRQIGGRVDLKYLDFDCLDLINRYGPLGPSALARRAGLHPATVTGVLDRLERGAWVVRDRDPDDRRGVLIRALRDRNAELFSLYAGMNGAMDEICAGCSQNDLQVIADFLQRVATAGQVAAQEVATA